MITIKETKHRKIIFEGNSLSNHSASGSLGGFYIPRFTYDALRVLNTKPLVYSSFAVSGQTQTTINTKISTNITPYITSNDIIVLWEGTNDMDINALSGADAFANVVTYRNTVAPYGVQLFICTVIARDFAGDDATLMTRIGDYNTLVRNNAATYGYTAIDLAASTLFDTRADASNTTYYNADKIHLVQAGQDEIVTMMTNTISPFI